MDDRPKPALAWVLNDARPFLARVPPLWSARARPGVVLRAEQRDVSAWAIWVDVMQDSGGVGSSVPVTVAGDELDAQLACEAVAVSRGLMPLPKEHGWRVAAIRAALGGLDEEARAAVLAEARRS